MTTEELLARESIRHTLACYNSAGDRLKVDDFVAQFTDDAIMESEGVQSQDLFRHEGQAAIRAWMASWNERAPRSSTGQRATFVRHHLSTCQIEFTGPTTAKTRTYWVAYSDIGPDHCGYYVDDFRRVGERWLIAHRRIRLDWRAANSLFAIGPAK